MVPGFIVCKILFTEGISGRRSTMSSVGATSTTNARPNDSMGLLVFHVLVVREQHIKILLGRPQDLAVLLARSARFGNRSHKLGFDLELQLSRETLVEKDSHKPAAS